MCAKFLRLILVKLNIMTSVISCSKLYVSKCPPVFIKSDSFRYVKQATVLCIKNHLILFLQEIGLLERDVTLRNFNSCQQQLTLIN